MNRPQRAVKETPAPASVPGSSLPHPYTPKVAGYAPGPFLDPVLVIPSPWRWYRTRTYVVGVENGDQYRALLVHSDGEPVGYWAIELLSTPLP